MITFGGACAFIDKNGCWIVLVVDNGHDIHG